MLKGLYVIIILGGIVMIFGMMISLLIDIIKPIIHIIFKGIKWLIFLVLEFLLFRFIFSFIYDKDKILFPIIATITLNIVIILIMNEDRIASKLMGRRKNGYDTSYYPSYSYVLNKRTGVIHDRNSESAKTVKDEHRAYLTRYEADELVRRGTRYHYKE